MSTVTLPNLGMTFRGVTEINDNYTDEALAVANDIVAAVSKECVIAAYVDRFEGTVLVADNGQAWHFRTPICGYDGTGPGTTARMLDMFGFGDHNVLMADLNHGGDQGKAKFYK